MWSAHPYRKCLSYEVPGSTEALPHPSHTHSNSCSSVSHLLYSFLALSLMFPSCSWDVCFKQRHRFYLVLWVISHSLPELECLTDTQNKPPVLKTHSCCTRIPLPLSVMRLAFPLKVKVQTKFSVAGMITCAKCLHTKMKSQAPW